MPQQPLQGRKRAPRANSSSVVCRTVRLAWAQKSVLPCAPVRLWFACPWIRMKLQQPSCLFCVSGCSLLCYHASTISLRTAIAYRRVRNVTHTHASFFSEFLVVFLGFVEGAGRFDLRHNRLVDLFLLLVAHLHCFFMLL